MRTFNLRLVVGLVVHEFNIPGELSVRLLSELALRGAVYLSAVDDIRVRRRTSRCPADFCVRAWSGDGRQRRKLRRGRCEPSNYLRCCPPFGGVEEPGFGRDGGKKCTEESDSVKYAVSEGTPEREGDGASWGLVLVVGRTASTDVWCRRVASDVGGPS